MTFQKENMLILQIKDLGNLILQTKDLGLAVQAMAASPLPGLTTFPKKTS